MEYILPRIFLKKILKQLISFLYFVLNIREAMLTTYETREKYGLYMTGKQPLKDEKHFN